MKSIKTTVITLFVLGFIAFQVFLLVQNKNLRQERDRYKSNTETLLDTVVSYKTRDSLSAVQIESLGLTLSEYKRFRSEDLALIKTLKARNRELQSINSTQAQTIIELQSRPKDTILLVDSIPIPAKVVYCGDEWYDFKGLMTQESFSGELQNRDAILITETVKYKRFLGFLWKTGIKNRKVDVVSKNPHTTIISTEHVTIKK